MKRIALVWTAVLIIIVGGLTLIGFALKAKNINSIMEKNLVDRAQKYYAKYKEELPVLGEQIKLSNSELKDNSFDPMLEKNCKGYTLVKNTEEGYVYVGYIKCPDYVTEGYSEE